MSFLDQGFQSLIQGDVFVILLPFLLIFAVVYGVMTKVKIFAEGENKKFATIIALVMGLTAVFQHYIKVGGENYDIVNIINSALPQVALVLVAIVMLFLMLGLFGKVPALGENKASVWISGVALLIVIYIFGSSAGFGLWSLPYWLQDYQIWSLVIVILVFALIIRYITGDDKPKPDDKTIVSEFGKLLK